MEIALKIANKIRANERFSAYILIPMWPEGVPTSAPIQRILYWQVGFDFHLQVLEALRFLAERQNRKVLLDLSVFLV